MNEFFRQIRQRQLGWLRGFISRFRPGQVPFAAKGNLFVPGPKAGLPSSVFALKATLQTNLWQELDEEFQRSWIEHLARFQEYTPKGEPSFFRDNVIDPLSWPDRVSHRLRRHIGELLPRVDRLVSESRQAMAVLEAVSPGKAEIPHECSESILNRKLAQLDSGSPWGTVSHLGHFAFFAKLAAQRNFDSSLNLGIVKKAVLEKREVIRSSIARNLGTPAATGGSMKLVLLSRIIETDIVEPEFLIDAALSCQDVGDACKLLNPLVVLDHVGEKLGYRKDDIYRFRMNRMKHLEKFQMRDGGFSFVSSGATQNYGGIRMTRGLPVGDVHGAHILGWAVYLLEKALTGEIEWQEPPT